MAEITGGEPLLQDGFRALAVALRDAAQGPVLVETNGTLDISVIPEGVRAILDVKCPGSGASGHVDWDNLRRLRPGDEVKFVLSTREDYEWAREVMARHALAATRCAVLFSPATPALSPGTLAAWILEDALPVRLQIQLHKVVGLP